MSSTRVASTLVVCEADDRPLTGMAIEITGFQVNLFSEDIDENVIESHISKLRKRLRHRLGYDPIQSQRYLGYTLIGGG